MSRELTPVAESLAVYLSLPAFTTKVNDFVAAGIRTPNRMRHFNFLKGEKWHWNLVL